MTFDSCLINVQPTETVFQAALILSGHQTQEQQSCKEPALQQIKQWDLEIALWPNFSSLKLPDNPPSLEPVSFFPRGGDENWTWLCMPGTPPGSQEEAPKGLSASILQDRALRHQGQLPPDSASLAPSAPGTAPPANHRAVEPFSTRDRSCQTPGVQHCLPLSLAFLSQTQMGVNDLTLLLEMVSG